MTWVTTEAQNAEVTQRRIQGIAAPTREQYTTAVYLEGIAAASNVADKRRYHVYFDSLTRGFGFLDRLIIQERDAAILPNIDYALGGLRQGLYYSEIRTDFVQHALSAISYLRFNLTAPAFHGLICRGV